MKEHYTLIFDEHPVCSKIVTKPFPIWCRKRFATAQITLKYDFKNEVSLLRQKLLLSPFFIELIQIKSFIPFHFGYKVEQKRIFLFFMMDGTICFTTQESAMITKAKKNNFYVSINQPGHYRVNSFEGDILALVISIDEKWLTENISQYSFLRDLVTNILGKKDPFSVMPQCKIDKDVNNWLMQLLIMKSGNQKILIKMLEGIISRGLEYYEILLAKKKKPDIHSVKQYLDHNFCNPNLSMETLVRTFPFSKRTLYNYFMKMFQTTAVQYYTSLRMALAKEMIENQKLPISEVWSKVGYHDETTFRQAYHNYCLSQHFR